MSHEIASEEALQVIIGSFSAELRASERRRTLLEQQLQSANSRIAELQVEVTRERVVTESIKRRNDDVEARLQRMQARLDRHWQKCQLAPVITIGK